METLVNSDDDDQDYERFQKNKSKKMLEEKSKKDSIWLKNAKKGNNMMKVESNNDELNALFNTDDINTDSKLVKKRKKNKSSIDNKKNKPAILRMRKGEIVGKSQEEKKKEFAYHNNEEVVKSLKPKTEKEALYDDQLPKTNLDNYIKQPNSYYPQKEIELLVLPNLIHQQPPFSMSEETHKIVSKSLTNYQPDNPEKKGIFAYDVHFIFTVSIFIIIAIIIAYILLIHYSDLHLQKKEKEMDKNKEKYLISFQKSYQLDSYLFYISVGFISISVFVLSLLAVRNVIFSNFKKI